MGQKEAIVLGAGITGLATGWQLAMAGWKVTVLEKGLHVGGLAGTTDWDGWKFDFGAHCFHTRDEGITALYRELLGDRFRPVTPTVKLHIFGRFVAYPLVGAHIFFVLNSTTMVKAAIDFFLSRLKARLFGFKKTERLDEWIIARFGRVLYDVYFAHYIERIQKTDPKDLSKDLGEKKIPIFSILRYLQREIFGQRNLDDITTLEYFYVKGGYGEIAAALRDAILALGGQVNTGEPVERIDVTDGEAVSIRTTKSTYLCKGSAVVSTLPLGVLVRAMDCEPSVIDAQAALRSSRMRFLLVKVDRSQVMGYRWVNVSEVKYPFYRVSEYCHDEFAVVPEGKCSLMFELPLKETDKLWSVSDQELADTVLPLFNELFTLAPSSVIGVRTTFAEHANPIMSLGYREALLRTFEHLDGIQNVHSVGRQGLFTYVNIDGCTKMGLDLSAGLIRGQGKSANRAMLEQVHGLTLGTRGREGSAS